ncbi:Bacteriophage HK97-gp10, putative tail-component [Paenibacillaceae bacterium GAS479]|nr:Bacteriophage HK97-gp10, putative tail-component [Paenibacillaceae bacterium GAS479]
MMTIVGNTLAGISRAPPGLNGLLDPVFGTAMKEWLRRRISMSGNALWKLEDPRQLQKRLLELERAMPAELEKMLRKEAETAIFRVSSRIPEEKKELREGWQISGIQRTGQTISVEIRHPSPEVAKLEYGSDKEQQKGRFMLALALAELERDWPNRLEQSLSAMLLGRSKGG